MVELFRDGRGRFEVQIEALAKQVMLHLCENAGGHETGGILIGHYDSSRVRAIITEATARPVDSESGRFTFRRGKAGLRELLQQRWFHGTHYLGEWHFHPGGSAQPSFCDEHAMERIAKSPGYACPEPILLIVGGSPPDSLDMSVTVFPRGHHSVHCVQLL